VTDDALLQRITRLEDRFDIGQLPVRYALAVDQRDLDTWVSLFVPNVSVGRLGSGRDTLRAQIEPQLRNFYRSIHQIVGHRIDLVGGETARGQTYCRAEHEVGDRWVVMAIRYDDEYQKVDGEWLFARRRERHWYAADLIEHPQSVAFNGWTSTAPAPRLPHLDDSWSSFWSGHDTSALTRQP
jgi:3-phenylpropionate/cinnamic acid dioxygenase small subunit